MSKDSIGELIRRRREELGMSQSRLASMAGISAAQVSRLESGERNDPSFEVIIRLAAAMDVSLDELAGPFRNDPGVDAQTWSNAGFEQVDEVVPGRVYEAWAQGRHFRIAITRSIYRGSTIRWNSSIDEAIVIPDLRDERDKQRLYVWTSPVGIPSRLRGDTPSNALRDALIKLAEWGGFNAIGRARQDAAAAKEMDSELRKVADGIDEALRNVVHERWRDRTRARWSNKQYDVFISKDKESQFIMMTYFKERGKHAKPVVHFPLNRTGAIAAAQRIIELFQE